MTKYNRMKDIVTDITEIGLDSGIEYEVLCKKVDEYRENGAPYEEAVDETRQRFGYRQKIRKAFRDMAEAIEELRLVALATGYRHDDLVTILKEDVDDGIFGLEECFEYVRDVSLEYDW